MAATTAKSKAMTVATALTNEELTALLQETGWAERPSADVLPRLKLDGTTLVAADTGEMFVYNPRTPTVPALTVRIVQPPEEYWAIWVDADAANSVGQPELKDSFSKKYVHPNDTHRIWASDEAFDSLKAAGNKASWKADMKVQIVPESGQLTGDEQTYLLTLSTTSLIEFKGASRDPDAGSVSDSNFIQKLSRFALESAEGDPKKAVIDALTSLTLGGVVADVRILRAENKEQGRTWSVISFDPIHIEPMQQGDLLIGSGDVLDDEDPGI